MTDERLKGNEKIEQYIEMLKAEPSEELLAVTLSSVRRRMQAGGQMIVPVDVGADGGAQISAMQLENGEKYLVAFTSFEEELMGANQVMSTFLSDISQLLDLALKEDSVKGLLINPWNRTLKLDKNLLRIIKGADTL